jgi:hypothetical protein
MATIIIFAKLPNGKQNNNTKATMSLELSTIGIHQSYRLMPLGFMLRLRKGSCIGVGGTWPKAHKSTQIRDNSENFKIAKRRTTRNTNSSPAVRRFAPPLLVLRVFDFGRRVHIRVPKDFCGFPPRAAGGPRWAGVAGC